MNVGLTDSEKKLLANHFRFNQGGAHGVNAIHGSALLDVDRMDDVLTNIQESLNAPSKRVAASIFAKRYSYAVAVTGLFTMTSWDMAMDLRLENISLVTTGTDELWLPSLHVSDQTVQRFSLADRDAFREWVVRSLFKENINPVLDTLSEASRISKYILWENTAIYLYWLYEKKLKEFDVAFRQEDFFFLLDADNGHLFGNYTNNPILRYHTPVEVDGIRVRKTCCLSYQLPDGAYCKTCPALKCGST